MIKILFCVLLLLVEVNAEAKSLVEQMFCGDSDDSCTDPCLHLVDGKFSVILNLTENLISINGKVSRLKLEHSTKKLTKDPRSENIFGLTGDRRSSVYVANNIKLVHKSVVVEQSCYEKNTINGVYEGSGSCCLVHTKDNFIFTVGNKTHKFNTTVSDGC